jgi:hypothetical protein
MCWYLSSKLNLNEIFINLKMKNIYLLSFTIALLLLNKSYAQIGINSTNTAPAVSAMLDVSSTNKGMLIPRMTTAQRLAIASPTNGLSVYDTDLLNFWFYNGTSWQSQLTVANNLWLANGTNIYNNNSGNIGIGINLPTFGLDVRKQSGSLFSTQTGASSQNTVRILKDLLPTEPNTTTSALSVETSSTNGGIFAKTNSGIGIKSLTVSGQSIWAETFSGTGIIALSNSGTAVQASSESSLAVSASSTSGTAIFGSSVSGNGVGASSNSNHAISGFSFSPMHAGVYGQSTTNIGVHGSSDIIGVYGFSAGGTAISGLSTIGYAIKGQSSSATAIYGISETGIGIFGISTSKQGVVGQSTTSYGVEGASSEKAGVRGTSASGEGVIGNSFSGIGVIGYSSSSFGLSGNSIGNTGIYGQSGLGKSLHIEKKLGSSGITALMENLEPTNTSTLLQLNQNSTGTALLVNTSSTTGIELLNSSIKVSGTNKMAFQVISTGATSVIIPNTGFANSLTDIILVTHKLVATTIPIPVYVLSDGTNWRIHAENGSAIPAGEVFNVLVFKQ